MSGDAADAIAFAESARYGQFSRTLSPVIVNQDEARLLRTIEELKAIVRDREAEIIRLRTHETAAAHALDATQSPEERHQFKHLCDRIAALEATVSRMARVVFKA